jgi:hypothetical protein
VLAKPSGPVNARRTSREIYKKQRRNKEVAQSSSHDPAYSYKSLHTCHKILNTHTFHKTLHIKHENPAYMTVHIIFLLKMSHCLKENMRKQVNGCTLQTKLLHAYRHKTHTYTHTTALT